MGVLGRKRQEDDKSLLTVVKGKVDNNMACAYYLIWKYCPDALTIKCDTLDDLKEAYNIDLNESTVNSYMYRDTVQKAAKYILQRTETKRDIELLNKAYERAMNKCTPNDIKSYFEIKKNLFKDENETNELLEILNNADVSINNANIKDMDLEMF